MVNSQLPLLTVPPPTMPKGIDLRCCGVDDVLDTRGVQLVHADPPWLYRENPGNVNPEENGIYSGLTHAQILAHLSDAYQCAAKDARLIVWCTWPQNGEWMRTTVEAGKDWPWGDAITGGSWHKLGQYGAGYHHAGNSEFFLMYKRGAPPCARSVYLKNALETVPGAHSEKPHEWMSGWLKRWTDPDALVLDLYAGMAPMARACALSGRRYIGAEISPKRWRQGLDRFALRDAP